MRVAVGFLCLSTLVFGEAAPLRKEASRVRILLAIDAQAEGVGSRVLTGGQAVEDAFRSAAAQAKLEDRVTIDVIGVGGGRLTPGDILSYYRNLQTSPDEALVFYYTGHGATDPRNGHFFQMSGGNLLRSDVLAVMEARQPRLAVLLTDCCSAIAEYLPSRPEVTRTVAYAMTKSTEIPPSVLRDLFFRETGVVDVTAAQTPQYAWAPRTGGLFSRTLAELISGGLRQVDVDGNGQIVWNEFLRNLRWKTNRRFLEFKADRYLDLALTSDVIQEAKEQTPELFKLPSFAKDKPVQLLRMKAAVDSIYSRDETPNGRPGMTILVDATIWNAGGRTAQVAAYFRYDDGTPVASNDAKYRAVDGSLVTFKSYKIPSDNARGQTLELYIPYALIPKSNVNRQVGLYVNIRDTQTDALLGGSPFLYERSSPANRPGASAALDRYLPMGIPDAVSKQP